MKRTTRRRSRVLVACLAALSAPGGIGWPAASAPLAVNGKIAFASDRTGNQDIFLMEADGTGKTPLTADPTVSFRPAWSPDGTKIAFVRTRDDNTDIYVVNADGTGELQLT